MGLGSVVDRSESVVDGSRVLDMTSPLLAVLVEESRAVSTCRCGAPAVPTACTEVGID